MIKCIKCGVEKEEKEFYVSSLKKCHYVCIHCSRLISKTYGEGHELVRKRNRKRWGQQNKKSWENLDPCLVVEPKECCHCKRLLKRTEFDRLLSQKDGLQSWCKSCHDSRHTDNPAPHMLTNARKRARDKGYMFDLTEEDIRIPSKCPMLGIDLFVSSGRGGPTGNSPSLDRIDNERGYVKGNVHVISHRANTIKTNATLEELEKIVNYLRGLRGE